MRAVDVRSGDNPKHRSRSLAAGEAELVADCSGAVYWPAERMLIVADLHLEKGSARARRGFMLPPYDTPETLLRLGDVIARYQPQCVVSLGDSLHDRGAAQRLGAADLAQLASLQRGRRWIWLTGNHDPVVGPELGGEVAADFNSGGLSLRHIPTPGRVRFELAGHLHPAARVTLGGVAQRHRCFALSAERLVLPAFGAFTGGLNVLDEAFGPLFPNGSLAVLVVGRDGVYPVPAASLGPDRGGASPGGAVS